MTLSVDVILPTHRGERWVAEAIESVLGQSWPHWHLIVVDDASPDATAERVEVLRRAHPDRITLLRLPASRRAAGARMHAASWARGDLLAFLDQDDRWHARKLERQVARFERDGALGALHTDVEIIDESGARVPGAADAENTRRAGISWGSGPALAAALFRANAIRLASAAVRRSAFEAVGGFDTSLFGGEDWEFWVRFAARFPIAHLPEPLLERRVHDANASRVYAEERSRGKLLAMERMAREHPFLAPHAAARHAGLLEEAGQPLALCTALCERLASAGVRWCHWKSNEHVGAAVAGRTDLDLLVDPADAGRFDAVTAELGFKRVEAPPYARFPGMSDRLGLDPETGALLHLHVHEQLILGAPRVKNHRLPLEALVLGDGRDFAGVRAPTAEMELLLLAVRTPLKVSLLRLARRWRQDGRKTLPSSLVREMEFLLPDVVPGSFSATVAKSGLELDADAALRFVRCAVEGSLTTPAIYDFRRQVVRALRPYRRESSLSAALRDARSLLARRRIFGRVGGQRAKRVPGRAPVVALVGADGAGKSSLARDLAAWLSFKLAVERAYLGIPRQDRVYRALDAARRRWPFLDRARWLWVAGRRLAASRRAARLARRGVIVIADRWPLPELWSGPQPMDGPRIAGALGPLERGLYARVPRPDRIFALRADLEVLRGRRPKLDAAVLARKTDAVAQLDAVGQVEIVDVARPYSEVLLDLKRRIFALL